jgi:hypothetical protein
MQVEGYTLSHVYSFFLSFFSVCLFDNYTEVVAAVVVEKKESKGERERKNLHQGYRSLSVRTSD